MKRPVPAAVRASSPSAEDFIERIENFLGLDVQTQTELLLYYLTKDAGHGSATAAQLASLRLSLHLGRHPNLPVFLSQGTRRTGITGPRFVKAAVGYALERSRAQVLRDKYLGRPSARKLASDLRSVLSSVTDPVVSSLTEEAVSCFEARFYRAAIVLGWAVAYGVFRHWLFRHKIAAFNATTATWKNPITVSVEDDFQELAEGVVIDTAKKAGAISKEEHKTLKSHLDARNSVAHPTPKVITPAVAEAYLDTILREVLPNYL